jgi:hypothetical protein
MPHASRIGDVLRLAAAPTFAALGLLTGLQEPGMADTICGHAASPLGGMVPMYLLMGLFHLAPWINVLSRVQRKVDKHFQNGR